MKSVREVACRVLVSYETNGGALRKIMDEVFEKQAHFPVRDRSFCRDLVYGSVQRLNTLDWFLKNFSHTGLDQLTSPIRNLLRLGAYQIIYLNERVPAYAAVNESVSLAKKVDHAGVGSFVNGVLRSLERGHKNMEWPSEKEDPVESFSVKYSHPRWMVKRWLDRLGKESCETLLKKNNEIPFLTIRVNTLKTSREDLFKRLVLEGGQLELSPLSWDGMRLLNSFSLEDSPSFKEGLFFVQDEASQLAVDVLDPCSHETVLDFCSGVGGKSTHIGQRMKNKGTVIAFDTSADRLQLFQENALRLGVSVVQPVLLDARKAVNQYRECADRVLVDPPCSGLGVIRRRPDLRWNKDYRKILKTIPTLQKELLMSAALCLKPGGILVYSTCTVEPEETDGILNEFLEERTDFKVERPPQRIFFQQRDAVTKKGAIRLYPHLHDTDGFFISRLKRSV